MNPDNPYAAPQTIDSRLENLPLAEQVFFRQRFPEWDTARLSRLADYSHAIRQMTGICLGLLTFLALGLVASYLRTNSHSTREEILLYGGLLLVPLAVRVWWGLQRANWMRHWGMFFDCLETVGIVMLDLLGILLCVRGEIHFGVLIAMLALSGLLLVHSAASFLAQVHARELFGPDRIQHHDLAGEVDFRRRCGIG